jgi:hypothetical protein
MKKVISILTLIFVGIIVILDLALFVLGWIQGIYRPLIPAWIILFALLIVAVLYILETDNELDEKDNDIRLNKDKIKQLKAEIDELKRSKMNTASESRTPPPPRNDNTNNTSQPQEQNHVEVVKEIDSKESEVERQEKPIVKEFEEEFYSSPNANGEFDRGHAKKQMTDDSFYKVVWKSSEAKGKLELLNKRDYSRLLGGFKSDCLYPVCEVANNKNDGKIITMLSSGSVVLHDNKWIIDNGQKIKINIE